MASTTDSDTLGAGSVTPGRDWRKSRRSMNAGNCVEVRWRKSSASYGSGACAEAASVPGRVLVRDTKQDGQGPVLAFAPGPWKAFTAAVRGGAA